MPDHAPPVIADLHHRLGRLQRRHRELEGAIEAETRRPWPDQATLYALKAEKLRVKTALLLTRAELGPRPAPEATAAPRPLDLH